MNPSLSFRTRRRAGALILSVALAGLAGCAEIVRTADESGRAAAKTVVPEALALYFPQVPKALYTPFTDCLIDNATGPELADLAQDALIGPDPQTAETIRAILSRPATESCLTAQVPGSGPAL
ncbi:hypothetical protein R5H30_13850 [Sulfitobacter sp. D35]|uniref:hypothetical protein n=1 Tax=Sulfitobacter sp. D35 TaxID=3083252 RepID=UPI00296EACA1|nr:hypothetical protein [Sulfitobacter sp. D35]MDW4499075.1 hypothetical protein [Sulfitobacter sp. D35]